MMEFSPYWVEAALKVSLRASKERPWRFHHVVVFFVRPPYEA